MNNSHCLQLSCVICLLALAFTDCSKTDSSSVAKSNAGDAGSAGEGGVGAGPAVKVCGGLGAISQCDPVTASQCDLAAGETCDDAVKGGFQCFPGPNLGKAGDFCDNDTVYCGATLVCDMDRAVCAHFCCDDSQCRKGTCTPSIYTDGEASVGECLDEFPSLLAAGAGGEGG